MDPFLINLVTHILFLIKSDEHSKKKPKKKENTQKHSPHQTNKPEEGTLEKNRRMERGK